MNASAAFQDRTPKIMGILNATPDSFSDGGTLPTVRDALRRAESMLNDGASILDVGGESTRPGADKVSAEEEMRRVLPVIEALARAFPNIPISIDTWKAAVAERALEAGASIINDISGLTFDPAMAHLAAKSGARVIIGHLSGHTPDDIHAPLTVPKDSSGEAVVRRVSDDLRILLNRALQAGIPEEKIAADPGLGFGKTTFHNLAILRRLPELKSSLGFPLVIGASRKRFVGEITGRAVCERSHADAAVSVLSAEKGADVLRVHDVRATSDALRIYWALAKA